MKSQLFLGNNIEILKTIESNSVDSIVTDPPYGISFMNHKWDYSIPSIEVWKEVFRVLKPGGHAIVCCGTRTQHRMTVNLEDAGFEIRDIIAWVYGSGFPKGYNVCKAIEATEKYGKSGTRTLRQVEQDGDGEEYELKGKNNGILGENRTYKRKKYTPSGKAKDWEGWGTALKPAMELWTLCRKPISEKTVAENILKWGTGGINIDGCRIPLENESPPKGSGKRVFKSNKFTNEKIYGDNKETSPLGRFPANFIHDGSEEVEEQFPNTKSGKDCIRTKVGNFLEHGGLGKPGDIQTTYGDEGSASRFFYCAKASNSEKNQGLEHQNNIHPTVKPVTLMKYLCRLITPRNGTILDPFMGTGTTGIGAKLEQFHFIGIEKEEDFFHIAEERIANFKEDTKNVTKKIKENNQSLMNMFKKKGD